MVLEVPVILIVPAEAVKVPVADKSPLKAIEAVVVRDPEDIVRLSSKISVPVIAFEAPVIVTVPPGAWVNVPAPEVSKSPLILIALLVAVIPNPLIVKLLKLLVPLPLIAAPEPARTTVLVLPVKVPLFIQLPLMVSVKLLALNVVLAPMVKFPLILIFAPGVKLKEVPEPTVVEKSPATVKAEAEVFVAAPVELNTRLPYV